MRRPPSIQLAGESMLSSGVDAVTKASPTTTCGTSWSRSRTSSSSYSSGSRSSAAGGSTTAAAGAEAGGAIVHAARDRSASISGTLRKSTVMDAFGTVCGWLWIV